MRKLLLTNQKRQARVIWNNRNIKPDVDLISAALPIYRLVKHMSKDDAEAIILAQPENIQDVIRHMLLYHSEYNNHKVLDNKH